MGKITETMREELRLLFYTLCDGLRLEVWRHRLATRAAEKDYLYGFSMVDEREVGLASLLALHLRSVGFMVQLEAEPWNSKRRPDFGIWLPASKEYIYLELKPTAWGERGRQNDYAKAIEDIEKLDGEKDSLNQRNGLIAPGFSKSTERQLGQLLEGFKKLSQDITSVYSYEKIGLECVDFQGMDEKSSYAVIGLWFRKEWNDE